MNARLLFVPIAATLLLSGCASRPKPAAQAVAAPPAIPFTVSQQPMAAVDHSYRPAPAMEQSTIPLMNQAQLAKVKVKPWRDSQGRVHMGETIVLIERPAEINMDALLHPERSYIPIENQRLLPGTGQWAQGNGPIAQGYRDDVPARPDVGFWEVYDPATVQILDLPEYDQGEIAERIVSEQMGAGYMKIYHDKLGWVGVPKQQMRPVNR